MEAARKFILDSEIDWPSADISYTWKSRAGASLVVILHFSRVVDRPERDLKLDFGRPLALSWEDECFAFIPTPAGLPMCTLERFRHWAYPTLVVEGSAWADRYAANIYPADEFEHHPVRHYLLLSMNDTLHILSKQPPVAAWITSADA